MPAAGRSDDRGGLHPSVADEPVTSASLSRHATPGDAVAEVTAFFGRAVSYSEPPDFVLTRP